MRDREKGEAQSEGAGGFPFREKETTRWFGERQQLKRFGVFGVLWDRVESIKPEPHTGWAFFT